MKKIKTVRDLAELYPEMYGYDYKWQNTEFSKNIIEVLAELGYKFKNNEDVISGEYNDIKGYLNCNIEPL